MQGGLLKQCNYNPLMYKQGAKDAWTSQRSKLLKIPGSSSYSNILLCKGSTIFIPWSDTISNKKCQFGYFYNICIVYNLCIVLHWICRIYVLFNIVCTCCIFMYWTVKCVYTVSCIVYCITYVVYCIICTVLYWIC